MRTVAGILLYLFWTGIPWLAHAQIYVCKDAAGRTISSDRQIAECTDRAMREFSRSGMLKREIPAPLTAEEKRQKQLQEEKDKAAAAALEDQQKSDRAMLARYRSEMDIEKGRRQLLDRAQERYKRSKDLLETAEIQLRQVQADMANAKKNQTKTIDNWPGKVDAATQDLAERKKMVEEDEAEIARINETFDQTLSRYREIAKVMVTK